MTTLLADGLHGQQHSMFAGQDDVGMRNMLVARDSLSDGGEPADITPFQKMLSATTGSLLTGLTSTLSTIFCLLGIGRAYAKD